MKNAVLLAAVSMAVFSGEAWAYPWMVKHDYGSCAACHVDPSGAGQLSSFGRTEAERLVLWRPNGPGAGVAAPSKASNFLWFLELPDEVNLSGNVRFGALLAPRGEKLVTGLEMAADLSATFTIADTVMIHGTGGLGRGDAVAPAVVYPRCEPASPGECGASFIARTWWAGLKLAEGAVLVRGGRLNVPFGLRNNEHIAWVRELTRTDTNVQQQLGASVAYNTGTLRTELMGLAGGFLPTEHEGGYSGMLEYGFNPTTYLGVSSLVSRGAIVTEAQPTQEVTRHAHGLFFRWAPVTPVVLLAEADLLAWVGEAAGPRVGYAAFAQADWELLQGVHVMLTAESAHRGAVQRGPSLGGWISAAWYVLPHCEVRLDNVLRQTDAVTPWSYSLVAQLHVYL